MPVQSVTSVKNENRIKFTSRDKKQQNASVNRPAGMLKAIPISLLMAMSPITDAQELKEAYVVDDKVFATEVWNENGFLNDFDKNWEIEYVKGVDSDEGAEKVNLSLTDVESFDKTIKGKKVPCERQRTEKIYVDALVVKDFNMVDTAGKPVLEYYVRGKEQIINGNLLNKETNEFIEKMNVTKPTAIEEQVSKDLWYYLSFICDDRIPVVRENKD